MQVGEAEKRLAVTILISHRLKGLSGCEIPNDKSKDMWSCQACCCSDTPPPRAMLSPIKLLLNM